MLIPTKDWGEDLTINTQSVKANLQEIQQKIAHSKVKIIAVTKYFGLSGILKGYEAGIRDFGESRAIDAIKKIESLPKEVKESSTFHFIGHLQTNKALKVVEHFDVIHSVDSLKLAKTISEAACKLNKRERILLQVNNAEEEQKYGYSKEILISEIPDILKLKNIDVIGLMNIAPLNASECELRELFKDIRNYRDKLENLYQIRLPELSMGMSNDYELAVQEGATIIRIGRKLFK